jgi:hypothetical protein
MLERRVPGATNMFPAMFPTPTKGNGLVRPNNLRSGKNQPDALPSIRRKLHCKQCGFICDKSRQTPSGGDLSGDGAFAGNTLSGTSAGFDLQGEGQHQAGAGCPLCGSKNFASASRVGQ